MIQVALAAYTKLLLMLGKKTTKTTQKSLEEKCFVE